MERNPRTFSAGWRFRHTKTLYFRPEVYWGGDGHRSFRIAAIVEDAIVVDATLGMRLRHVANAWGDCIRAALGASSVIETETSLEGNWAGEQIIFGFIVNDATGTISLPQAKMGGAKRLIEERHYDPGDYVFPAKSIQER